MTVTLLDSMGSDRSIVDAARESFNKKTKGTPVTRWEKFQKKYLNRKTFPTLTKDDIGLINYLMMNRHGTPFEMVQFTFHVECPIFEAREWFRHRIGSFNERSGRYVQFEPKFYLPTSLRTQKGKPGAYTYEPLIDLNKPWIHDNLLSIMDSSYQRSYDTYFELMKNGVAKEQARLVLPAALITGFYWSVNLRSLMNFLSLRTAQDAMEEIRKDAEEVERLVTHLVPVAMEAFNKNGRVSP